MSDLRRAAATLLLCLPLLLGLVTGARAQSTPYLVLDPTQIPASTLNGAVIKLIPKFSTIAGAGGGGGASDRSHIHPDDRHPDPDINGPKDNEAEYRLSAAGLALITLSGAPSGLTIASGKILAREAPPHPHGGAPGGHRSAQITLAYTGSPIAADDTVTVTVTGGSGGLLRLGNQGAGKPGNLSATLDIMAAVTDTTAPRVVSITRHSPTSQMTDSDTLTWHVTFNEAVTNVDAADFDISNTTAGLAVTAVGNAGTTYEVTASGGNLAGLDATVTLSFATVQDIEDTAGNDLTDTAPTGTNHDTFVVNNTQAILSISAPANANEGNAGTDDRYFTVRLSKTPSRFVAWKVCFAGGTAMIDRNGGAIGPGEDYQPISGTQPITSAGSTVCFTQSFAAADSYTLLGIRVKGDTDPESDEEVTATLTIDDGPSDVVLGTPTATHTILDDDTGTGTTIDTTAPSASIARLTPTTTGSLTWKVVFSEPVTNVDASDFTITGTTATLSVSGSAATYDVTASGGDLANLGSDTARVTLGFARTHDIQDESGNRLTTPTVTSETELPEQMATSGSLLRYGRTMGEQAVDAIAGRLRDARSPGFTGSIAGHELATGTGTVHLPEDATTRQELTEDDLMEGTGFAITSSGQENGTSLSFWGQAARSGFAGTGPMTFNGTVSGIMIGADTDRDGRRLGLMLMHNRASGSYDDGTASGKSKAQFTSLVPWGGFDINDRLRFWAALGAGRGKLTLTPEDGRATVANADWRMAAAGMRAALTAPADRFGLDAYADGLWSRTRSDAADGLAATRQKTTRLRAGIEGSWSRGMDTGSFTSRARIGLRRDGGDAETGLGIELGAGVGWQDLVRGLTVSLDGDKILKHDDDGLDSWSLAATLAYDPAPDTRRGVSAHIGRSIGSEVSGSTSGGDWQTGMAYGVPRGGGMVGSSYLELAGEADVTDARIGWRIEPDMRAGSGMSFDLWTEPGLGAGEQAVGVRLVWPFN